MKRLIVRANQRLERHLPEQRLFLRSDKTTRYVRLRPVTQAVTIASVATFFAWGVIATSILLMDSIGSGNLRDQALRDQANYEQRLNQLATERDMRAVETEAAQSRFAEAMERISEMQMQLLASEQRRLELETGIDAIHNTIRRVTRERDDARSRLAEVTQTLQAETGSSRTAADRGRDVEEMLDYLLAAMDRSSKATHELGVDAEQARNQAQHLALENELLKDRNHVIFSQLEEALDAVVAPLERVFRSAGVSPDQIRRLVRQGASSQTASLRPIAVSTSGTMGASQDIARANAILNRMADVHAYRQGLDRLPVARPVNAGAVRETSGFGMRRHPLTGRSTMHNGLDWAGPRGTPIVASADGVVKRAGREGGYGNMVVIEHDFGIETYYAHLNSIDVRPGQRVSRGQRIGGMGTTGASTGVHLHYEVRVNGRPVNPITYIRAGQHVF
ncbi:MAG: peptidoglycan DD-metalloendopeptidase family protein [Natronohydrobacter sp.]|nr:peptidoglycan DD-metalloendopeptidase family protein [Natronohydrobacter sp.]